MEHGWCACLQAPSATVTVAKAVYRPGKKSSVDLHVLPVQQCGAGPPFFD